MQQAIALHPCDGLADGRPTLIEPFGDPGARWLLLGPDVEMRRTHYGLEQAAKRIRATTYPQAESFAATNVLHPPAEAEMLETFTRAGLK